MSDTESFESVVSSYGDRTWIGIAAIDRLKAAHDREIRDTAQREYHRGYVDAMHARATETWQLDRERMEVARRIRDCRATNTVWVESAFERIGGAILGENGFIVNHYEDIEKLIERLIHLLGGDSNLQDSPNPINKDAESPSYFMESTDFNKLDDREKVVRKLQALQFDGGSHENLAKIAYAIYPCATGWTCESAAGLRDMLVRLLGGCDGGRGVSEHVRNSDKSDDDSDSHSELAEEITAYDVLGNERQKAVCELRNLSERGNVWGRELIVALGLSVNATNDDMCDRLIHLLGGDQTSGIDVLREMDAESDTNGTCPNDVPTSSITDELREYVAENRLRNGSGVETMWGNSVPYDLLMIADRIDEQFDRICQQQKDVLQSTIDDIVGERGEGHDLFMPVDVFLRERDKLRHDVEMWRDRAEDMRMERDATLAELNARNDTDAVTQLYRLLKSTLGEAKCIRDRLVAQSDLNHKVKAYADRCRDDCHMYREMLNDAAKEYADLIESMTRDLNDTEAERDRLKAACEANHDQINRLKNAHLDKTLEVAALTEEYDMYIDLLKDASEEYKLVAALCDELEEQRDKLTQLVANMRMERNELQKRLSELETFDPE